MLPLIKNFKHMQYALYMVVQECADKTEIRKIDIIFLCHFKVLYSGISRDIAIF